MLFGIVLTREGTSFDAMVRYQQEVARDRPGRLQRRDLHVSVGSGGRSSGINEGIALPAAQAAQQAQARRRRRGPRAHRPRLGDARGSGVSSPILRSSTSVDAARAASTSSPCRAPISTSCSRQPSEFEAAARKLPGITDVTSDLQIKNPQVQRDHRPGPRRPRWESPPKRCRKRSTTPTAPGRCPPSSPRRTSTGS